MAQEFSLGAWISKRRRALDLTQEALAEQVGYSAAMLRKIESDGRRPSPKGAALLAAALQIPEEEREAFLRAARQERAVDELGLAMEDVPFPWASAQRKSNLPLPATLLVGREHELADLMGLLADPACRLVTLVGLAGIGKTRLALQAAHKQLDRFADGVYFVALAQLGRPESVIGAIASAVGFQFHSDAGLQQKLLYFLKEKQLLLVLDNFEHLMEGAKLVAEILQAAPEVQLLVTSRERLNLQGEWVFEVEALPYPPRAPGDRLERLEAYGAIQLFLQGALRVDPRFNLNDENREWVVEICRQMEGIPLAIELAAAWVRALSCQEIAREIQYNLDFLKASARDIPERHKSLRAALDHSWNLLSAREKEVLRRLSVFQCGFRRSSAQAVAGATLAEITALLDKSLLKRVAEERYDLHELVRQYAAAHLASQDEEQAQTVDRFSSTYASLLKQWEGQIRSPAQMAILAEIELEIENVRPAWSHMVARQQLEEIRKSLRCLWHFHEIRARFREGAALFHEGVEALQEGGEMIAEGASERAIVLGQLLAQEGYFCAHLDRYEEAAALLAQSLSLLGHGSDRAALADTLGVLGYLNYRRGEYVEGWQFAEESLALNRELDNQSGIVFDLITMAYICLAEGAYGESYRLCNESLAICRDALGDPHGTADCLIILSAAARQLGRHGEARQWSEEGLEISKTLNDRWSMAQTLRQLGRIHLELRDPDRAERLIRQSITLAEEIGDRMVLAAGLITLGLVDRASEAEARSNQRFLEALQTAMESNTITVALHALAEIAVSAKDNGSSELALELATYGLQHPLASARLKARWHQIRAELAPWFTSEQLADIEERTRAWTLEDVAQNLLATG